MLRQVFHNQGVVYSPPWALDLNFLTEKIDPRIVFSRPGNGTATRINAVGQMETVAANMPRIDYLNGVCAGLLIEEQRPNVQPYSDIDGTVGSQPASGQSTTAASMVVSADVAIGPNGRSARHTIIATGGDSNVGYMGGSASVASGDVLTRSAWVWLPPSSPLSSLKLHIEGTATVGAAFTQNTLDPARLGQWQRLTCSCTATAAGTAVPVLRVASGVQPSMVGAYFYSDCWQCEPGAFATSYIPTTAAQATRAADVATLPWALGSEGLIVADALTFGLVSSFPTIWCCDDGTTSNQLLAYFYNSVVGIHRRKDSVAQGDLNTPGTVAPTSRVRSAYGFKVNDDALSANGSATSGIASAANLSVPPVSRLLLGSKTTGAYLNGYLRRLRVHRAKPANSGIPAYSV